MDEIKIWKSYEKKDDKLIICHNHIIYKANPLTKDVDNVVNDFIRTKTPTEAFFTIPFSYTREIRLQENRNYIEILFGRNSSEHFKISDSQRKNEIFEFLGSLIPNSVISLEEVSISKIGKKPLIGFFTLTIFFMWTYFIAEAIECNPQYYVKGSPNSLFALVLGVATLGTSTVTIIYLAMFLIAILGFVYKIKTTAATKVIRRNTGRTTTTNTGP